MNRGIFSLLFAVLIGGAGDLSAQGTAFNYQGRLSDGGTPANGRFDLRFAVYDAVTNGTQMSVSLTNAAVPVSSGLFNVTLDFGPNIFTGSNCWLDIAVKATNVAAFTVLAPRQPVLPVPYAMFAAKASNVVGSVSAAQITGTAANPVNFTNNNNQFGGAFSGIFSGNGAALTNLNASNLATGTVADGRLSTNVALLNGNQTFSGTNSFTNWNNSFTGSFFGNGLVGWIATNGQAIQAERDHGYLLTSSGLATVTLPQNTNLAVGDIVRISGAGSGGWRVALNANQSIYGSFYNLGNALWLESQAPTGIGWETIAANSDGSRMAAAGGTAGNGIYTSTDSGKTWNNISGTPYTPSSLASSSDGAKLVGTISGSGIVVSTNAGDTWTMTSAASAAWTCVASSTDGVRLAATVNGGKIYTSADSGSTWTARDSNRAWDAVACSSAGSKLAAVVYGGKIYTSVNYGTNWTQQTAAPTANWISIASSSDGTKLAAVVYGGKIYTSTDSGTNWIQQTNAPTLNWWHIVSSSDGARLGATANGNGVYVSIDFGATWNLQPIGAKNWKAIACSSDGTKLAAGYATLATSGGIFYMQVNSQVTSSTIGSGGYLSGSQGTAVELQYIGNGQFMPVSSSGTLWVN